jgi:hypothetical protein
VKLPAHLISLRNERSVKLLYNVSLLQLKLETLYNNFFGGGGVLIR